MRKLMMLLTVLAGILLWTGCLPSLNPLSEKSETHLTDMTGMWKRDKDLYTVTPGKEYDTVVCGDVTYKVIPAIVNGKLFVSITVSEAKMPDGLFPFVMGCWSIYRLDVQGDTATLSWIRDMDPVINESDGKDGKLHVFRSQDHMPLMVSDTKTIRKWMESHTELYTPDEKSHNFMTFTRTEIPAEEKK